MRGPRVKTRKFSISQCIAVADPGGDRDNGGGADISPPRQRGPACSQSRRMTAASAIQRIQKGGAAGLVRRRSAEIGHGLAVGPITAAHPCRSTCR